MPQSWLSRRVVDCPGSFKLTWAAGGRDFGGNRFGGLVFLSTPAAKDGMGAWDICSDSFALLVVCIRVRRINFALPW